MTDPITFEYSLQTITLAHGNRYWLPITDYFDYYAPYGIYTRNPNTAMGGGVLLNFWSRNIIWTFMDDKWLFVCNCQVL